MKLLFLGTGTSVGVPMIGCDCAVCSSTDLHNRRRRSSIYIEADGVHVVVDTAPDFREQALEHRLPRVDAVFFTHTHADHIFGLDDIRRFNTVQKSIIPAYAPDEMLPDLRRIFDYVENPEKDGVYRPHVPFRSCSEPVQIGSLRFTALPVEHGPKPTVGYLVEHGDRRLGYVPDCHQMPDETVSRLRGVDVMVLDALRHRPHPTHLTVEQSVALLDRIGAAQSYTTHMCHDLDHDDLDASLPDGVHAAYDGLALDV